MSLAPSTSTDSSTSSSSSPTAAAAAQHNQGQGQGHTRRPSYGNVGVGNGLGLSVGTLPLPFMQVVECAETDADGRVVRRDRKVAPRIDWLGGKFFFAGLKKYAGEEDVDFELIMEGPWARRRKGPM